MNKILPSLAAALLLLAALWYALGSTGLAIGLAVITIVTVIFAAFGLGWFAAFRAIKLGSDIALDSQRVNANENSQLLQLARSFAAKEKTQPTQPLQYPMLPAGDSQQWLDIPVTGGQDEPQ
jgi:hypothetical protein